MPNWCENVLRIQGDKESLQKFLLSCRWKGAKGRSESFSFMPFTPKEYQEKWDSDWAREYWGTKWDADTHGISISKDGRLCYISFDTAWSPPIPMISIWERLYPSLSFTIRYYEGGMWFMGEDGVEEDLPVLSDNNEEQEEAHSVYVEKFLSFEDIDGEAYKTMISIPLIEGEKL